MNQHQPHLKGLTQRAVSVASLALALLIAGCAGTGSTLFTQAGSGTTLTLQATGSVHGGQQPISGATIQLYTVGTTGTASASTALISSTVTSSDGSGLANANANAGNASNTLPAGYFTITGAYSCTSATQVYLVASGGNPGSGINSAISEVVALGSCASLKATPITINITEVTTVAAAYALAPFATDLVHVGSTSSTAIGNAMTIAQNLANVGTGVAGGAALPAGAVVPTAELDTLADILSTCVNTTGPSSPACTQLFTATGASDIFGAALAIAHNPGATAITGLYSMATANGAPFQPSLALSAAPNDFSVAIKYNAGGSLATPWGIAVDASGNAWVTNETGASVTEFSPTGTLLQSPTANGLSGAQGIAIDRNGNVWVANTAGNSVIEFALASGLVTGSSSFTAGGISGPSALAIDSAGDVFVANYNGNSVTELSSGGANLNSSPFTGSSSNITNPIGIAVGHGGGSVYVTSGLGYVVKLSNSGVYKNNVSDNALQGPNGIAINATGQIGVTGSTTGTSIAGALGEFTDSSNVLTVSPVSPVNSGLVSPAGIVSDGVNFFVANSSSSGSLAEFSYGSASSASPVAGYGTLNSPVGVAVDPSGSVWTANSGDNTVSQFVGLAQPATTPLAAVAGP
jgi:streptogramin lyase